MTANNAPSGTSATLTIPRSYALHRADFGFSDADGDAFQAVLITTLPGAGTLYYDSNGALGGGLSTVTAGETISAADILAGKLTYLAPSGASGAGYASFTFQVQDAGGTGGGGLDLDQSPNTLTFDVVASAAIAARFGSLIDLTLLSSADGFKIQGDLAGDLAGSSVSSAGDINGDGFADILIGANGNHSGGPSAGAAYVIFGKAGGFGTLDLTGLSVADGFKIQGDATGDGAGSVSSAGDINGDGFADIIVGAKGNNGGGNDSGAAYVIYGKSAGFGSLIDLTGLSAADGFKIQGDAAYDQAGISVSSAGDVNGDGFADILVGAIGNSGGGAYAGAAYVIFGKSGGFGSLIDLTGLLASAGFKIQGDANGDLAGCSVSSAGDINGDGFADILVGASDYGGNGPYAGAAWVIFGKAGGFGTLVDLHAPLAGKGFRIQGGVAYDHAGLSVSSAGDVNGDGFADMLVGSDDAGGHAAGAAYVIFGRAALPPNSRIDIGPTLSAADGFKIQGGVAGDRAGISLSAAGDVNGDGFGDIIVGATNNDSGGIDAGAAYVLFGKASGFGTLIDLSTLSASVGFKIQGDLTGDQAGSSVSAAGDVNGDGFADILVGALANDSGGSNAGAAYVIFGRANAGTAPSGTSATLTILEDTPRTFAAADFGFSDGDGNALAGVVITTLPLAGTLTQSGTPVNAGQTIVVTDLTNLVFTPVVNANGAAYVSFTFQVQDDGGTTNGGVDLDQSPNTLTFDVTAVNDAPSGTNNTVTTLEDAAYVFSAADFGFADSADGPADIMLAVKITTLPVAGTLTLSGTPVTAGQTIAAADLANVVFTPAANANGTGYASFTFQVQDDGGTTNGGVDLDQSPNTLTLNVTAVNDAPTLNATASNPNFTEAAGLGTQAAAVGVYSGAASSTIEAGQTISGLTFTVAGLADGTNEKVSLDGSTFALTDGATGTTTTNGFSYTVVVVSGTATVTLAKAAGITTTLADALVNSISYQDTSTDDPTAGNRVFTLTQIKDNGGTANSGADAETLSIASTVGVVAVNDAPTASLSGTNPTYTEDGAGQALFTVSSVSTVETGQNIKAMTFTVTNVVDGGGASEIITFDGSTINLSNGNSLTTSANSFTASVVLAGSTATVTLTKAAGVSVATFQTLLGNMSYGNANQNPWTANRVVTLTSVTDTGGTLNSGNDTANPNTASTVTVHSVNDAPTLTATGQNPTFNEGSGLGVQGTAVNVFNGSALSAVESGQAITSLKFTVSGLVDGANEKVVVDGSTFALTDGTNGNTASNAVGYTVVVVGSTATVTLAKVGGVDLSQTLTAVNSIQYQNTNIDVPTAGGRVFTLTEIKDDGGTANGGHDTTTLSFASTVTVTPADDFAVAVADFYSTNANAMLTVPLGTGVLNNDTDPDGPSRSVISVNGVGADVGNQITLASGALLTLNGDGSFGYDPNHKFDGLAPTGSGAANASATDSFTYAVNGGASTTVTLTINGVNNASTIYQGGSGDDTINGDPTVGSLFRLEQGGNDIANGGSGNDGFYFGGALTSGDHVNGGGGNNDQIGLEGTYVGLVLDGTLIQGVEVLAMLPGFDYTISTVENFVASGKTFTFWSVSMGASNHVSIDGHLEADGGRFNFFLGQGNDTAIGGSGADLFYGEGGRDTLTGNGGADIFAYLQVSDSHGNADGTAFDTITDFTAGADKIQLAGTAVIQIDAAFSAGLVGSFDAGLAAVLGNGQAHELDVGHAVLFTVTGGGGFDGHTYLVVGTSGAATGYTAGADYVFDLQGAGFSGLAAGDFV